MVLESYLFWIGLASQLYKVLQHVNPLWEFLGHVSGATHKREWDAFVRSAGNRSKFPVQLSEFYTTNKIELFNFWLDSGRDWQSCVLKVERTVEAKNRATKGWEAVQGKDLRKQYTTKEKFDKVVEARKSAGLYYEDDDFPGDIDDPHLNLYSCFFWRNL